MSIKSKYPHKYLNFKIKLFIGIVLDVDILKKKEKIKV